ncbi:MAG: hypothetical protein U0R50_16750 [Gaiellales bacterium]
MDLIQIARALCRELEGLSFAPPVTHVYNPLVYAADLFAQYAGRWGSAGGRVLLLGMNPGPFGMAQTGIPFGDVTIVRDWLGLSGAVGRPANEHPRRPVEGLACRRTEVSGTRLWSWARARYDTPERFFESFFVLNYCPLAFLEESGRNRTPDKLPAGERQRLYDACDAALVAALEILAPRLVVGVGDFARTRAAAVAPPGMPVGSILHPSPASPRANRGWAEQAERELGALGVEIPRTT